MLQGSQGACEVTAGHHLDSIINSQTNRGASMQDHFIYFYTINSLSSSMQYDKFKTDSLGN